MNTNEPPSTLDARRYRIRVAGRLSEGFAEGIGADEQHAADGTTTLVGELQDQSQLYGVLDRLRSLGLEILSFETIGPAPTEDRLAR